MPASWVFDMVDRAGRSVTTGGITLASDITCTFQGLGNSNSVQLSMPVDCAESALILNNPDNQYYVKGYRTPSAGTILDRRLRFYGQIEVDELVNDELSIIAIDPLETLTTRYTTATITSQDVGTTIRQLVNTTNSIDGETGIQTDPSWVSLSVSQAFDGSQNAPSVATVITEFANQLDGPETWIEPIEYTAGKIGRLYVSASRGVNSGVVFGYGEGTVGNCAGMGRVIDRRKIVNDIRPTGDAIIGTSQVDATSVAAIGRRVERIAYTGDTVVSSINRKARGRLNRRSRASNIAEYKCEPDYGAPSLFDDFNIGDIVTLDYRNSRVRWIATPRVVSATVRVNNVGREQPADIAFYTRGDVG